MLCTTLDPRFKVHFLENDEMVHILKSTLNQICEETWLSWFSQLSKENIPRTFLLAPTIKKRKSFAIFGSPAPTYSNNIQEVMTDLYI